MPQTAKITKSEISENDDKNSAIIDMYKELNDKCDVVLEKIKTKQNKFKK